MIRTSCFVAKVTIVIVLLFVGFESASAYVYYLIGKRSLPGCDFDAANTCVVKVEAPGPEEPVNIVGEANIDYSTSTQVGSVLFMALPTDAQQFRSTYGFTMVTIWYTTDGSPCPIPNP